MDLDEMEIEEVGMDIEEIAGIYEIAGDTMIGDGASEVERLLAHSSGDHEIGARQYALNLSRSKAGRNAMMQAAAQRATAHDAVVRTMDRVKSREYVLGFDSGANVAAGAQATITSRPQVLFRGERLLVPSDIAGSFTIDDIRVGKNSQTAASGGSPARVFQETGVGVRLHLDTCQVAMDVVLQATNISGAAIRFRAAIIGAAVE